MTNKDIGPSRSDAQKIGNDADAAINAHKPERWHMGRAAGDDFGYDYTVTAWGADDNQGAQYAFNIQLKGTTQAKARVDDGAALAHSFNRTTLTLWHNSGTAILVAIADLIDDRDPLNASVYFKLVNEEIDDVIDDLPDDQKSLTIHVPLASRLHRGLDVVPAIDAYQQSVRMARRLVKKAKAASGGLEEIASILEASSNGASIGLSGDAADEEIERIIRACGRDHDLGVALTLLRAGSYERALDALGACAKSIASGKETEEGISEYLRYRALSSVGNKGAAQNALKLAYSFAPQVDEISAAHFQSILDGIDVGEGGRSERELLLAKVPQNCGTNVMVVKAKVLCLDGHFEQARSILKSLPESKAYIPKIVVSIVEQDWSRAISEAIAAKQDSALPDRQRLWVLVLEARARFQGALRDVPREENGLLFIPSTGLPGMNFEALRSAHECARQALMCAQRLNWPSDMHYMLDVVSITTLVLALEAGVLPLLISFVSARPNVVEVREAISKLCLQVGNPEAVLEIKALHAEGPCYQHEELLVAVAAFKAGKAEKVFDYLKDGALEKLDDSEFYLSSLMIVGIAASAALRFEVLHRVRQRLVKTSRSLPYLAILESAIAVNASLLGKRDVLERLHQFWSAAERPLVVAHHLLGNADEAGSLEAAMILEVADYISRNSGLSADEEAKVGRALLSLKRPVDAVANLQRAHKKFPADSEIGSILGIALEASGRSAEAFSLIGGLLDEGAASEGARNFYVDIAVRFGFLEEAERQLRALYVASSKSESKLRLLSALFQILLAGGNRQVDLEDIAWQFGCICDQQSERQEASFLQQYLLASINSDDPKNAQRASEFRRRMQAFSERFPESKLLRPVRVPDAESADTLLAALHEAIGSTPESRSRERAIVRRMNHGQFPIPFSWRPRRFLKDVSDVFMLWDIRKRIPQEELAYHFQNSIQDYSRESPGDLEDRVIVLSLCSILLLHELDLLEFVLGSFKDVVIARATIGALSEAKGPLGSGWSKGSATEILRVLQDNFQKIKHPAYWGDSAKNGLSPWHEEERHAVSDPRAVYFCDDVFETIFVCGHRDGNAAFPSISIVELIAWAEAEKGAISKAECARIICHLHKLKVGRVSVSDQYLVAAFTSELRASNSEAEADAAFDASDSLRGLLDGVWAPSIPFSRLLDHMSRIFSQLIISGDCSDSAISRVWQKWLQAVRFQEEPRISTDEKVAFAFLRIIGRLSDDTDMLSRAWRIYWSVLGVGLPGSVSDSPDKAAARTVGHLLGSESAEKMPSLNTGVAGDLLRKAKLGLISGTDVYAALDQAFVDAAVERTKTLIESGS